MFIVHIHKLVVPNAMPDSYATLRLQMGEQKFASQMTLPLSPHHTEYNLYNERFTFQDPIVASLGLTPTEKAAQELHLKV